MMRVGVIGASGLVGQRILRLLSQYKVDMIPLGRQSREIEVNGQIYSVKALEGFNLSELDGVFLVSSALEAKRYYPKLSGWVVDASIASYEDPKVPMVVPELYQGPKASRMISPNCIAIPVALILSEISREYSVKSVWGSSYQSVSGAGFKALVDYQNKRGLYDRLDPGIGGVQGDLSHEEWCIKTSLLRLGYQMPIEILAVRVPVGIGHGMHLRFECSTQVDRCILLDKLKDCPYIEYREGHVPTNQDVKDSTQVALGRVRVYDNIIDLWGVSDNLWRGAAWNMVEIARQYYGIEEKLYEQEKTR